MVFKVNTKKSILFAADSMLGKLARHLRVMGYDTVYQSKYNENDLIKLSAKGRVILTKNQKAFTSYPHAILIEHNTVKDQIKIVDKVIGLSRDHNAWFNRCSLCNSILSQVEEDEIRNNVPDFVFARHPKNILFCPACKKFYWPGTHKDNMMKKLKSWGF